MKIQETPYFSKKFATTFRQNQEFIADLTKVLEDAKSLDDVVHLVSCGHSAYYYIYNRVYKMHFTVDENGYLTLTDFYYGTISSSEFRPPDIHIDDI